MGEYEVVLSLTLARTGELFSRIQGGNQNILDDSVFLEQDWLLTEQGQHMGKDRLKLQLLF